jgi:tetratricopeptide (TPR) repeat protein
MRSRRHLPRLLVLAIALLPAFPDHLALAKGSHESDVARAERGKGTVALNLGQYDEAIDHFSEAYALTQDPVLLFNLGQAYRLAGRADKSLSSYSSFLRAAGGSAKYRAQLDRAAAEIEAIAPTLVCRPADRVGTGRPLDEAPNTAAPPPATPAAAAAVEPPPVEKAAEAPPAPIKAPVPVLSPPPPQPAPAPALALSAPAATPVEPATRPVYKRAWFWTSVAVALVAGGAAAWWYTRPVNQVPASSYGSTRVLP